MANAERLKKKKEKIEAEYAEKILKFEAEQKELQSEFGEAVFELLDVTTPTEFNKFVKANEVNLNKLLNAWRQPKVVNESVNYRDEDENNLVDSY